MLLVKLNIAAALKAPGKVFELELAETIESFEYLGREFILKEPLKVELSYSYNGAEVAVSGELRTVFLSSCSRCTKEYDEPFIQKFDERFVKNAADDDEAYPFTGDELALDQMIRDCVLLNLSPFGVCKEDCKGLCPICGCDLNKLQCQCQRVEEPERANPFEKLGELFNDGKEV